MSERSTFLNTFIDNLTMKETIDLVNQSIKSKTQLHHTVINAGKVVAMHKNVELRESVNNSDIINADGQAIVWGARILGEKIKERVAGIDLMNNLVELASENNYKIYLLGAKEEVVSKLVDIYSNKYGQQIIAGYRNGYFRQEEEKEIIQDIANS